MRTSPLAMRLSRRACALAAALALTLVVSAAACGDDDGDDGASPTTTAPATTTAPDAAAGVDETTTTTASTGSDATEPAGTAETEPAETGLTAAEFDAEVRSLYASYSSAFVSARQRGALDEQFRADLARVYFPALVEDELEGLNGIGGIDAIVPEPGPVVVSNVEMEISTPTCASGSATFDLRPVVGDLVPGPRLQFFKLETSDSQPGWRFAVLGSTQEGEPVAGSACEEG